MKQSYVYVAFIFAMPCQADELPGSGVRGANVFIHNEDPYETSWSSSSSGPTLGQSTNPPVTPGPTPGMSTYLPVTPGPTPGMTTSLPVSPDPTPGSTTNFPESLGPTLGSISPGPTPGMTTYLPITPGPTPAGMTTYLPVTPGPTPGTTTSLPISPGPTPGSTTTFPESPGPTPGSTTSFPSGSPGPTAGSTTTFPSGSSGPTPCPTMDLIDYNMTECCTCPNTTNVTFTEPVTVRILSGKRQLQLRTQIVTFEQYESLFVDEFDDCGCTCECDDAHGGGGIWRNRELQFGTGAYFPGGACHAPTQRERRRGMDFDGQVKFVDCDTSDIRLIPEDDDGDPYVAPASNVVDDIDGFCIKGSSQWFKIPNHCKVLITCTPKNSKPEAGFPDAGKPGKIKWKYFCEDFEGLKVDCYNIFATVTLGIIVEPKHDSTKPAWRDPYWDWPNCTDTKHW